MGGMCETTFSVARTNAFFVFLWPGGVEHCRAVQRSNIKLWLPHPSRGMMMDVY